MSQFSAVFSSQSEELSSANLSTIEPFKKAVMAAFGGEEILSLKTDEDWFDLRHEVCDVLAKYDEAQITAYLEDDNSVTYDNVEVWGEQKKEVPSNINKLNFKEIAVQTKSDKIAKNGVSMRRKKFAGDFVGLKPMVIKR